MSGRVTVIVGRHVATVTLVNPDRRNAIDTAMAHGLVSALSGLAADDEVRCVVVRGAGGHFSVGGDLSAGAGGVSESDEEAAIRQLRAAMESAFLLHTMPKPTVAAVEGACAGAGLSLACAADIRLASTTAVFNTAFVGAGVSGDYGGTWLLPRIVGDAAARELYLLASKFDADHALRLGLVSRLCPPERLDAEIEAVSGRLASLPPLALREAKANLNDAVGPSLAEHLGLEAQRHARTARTEDAAEAAAAFLEKRAAVFHGR